MEYGKGEKNLGEWYGIDHGRQRWNGEIFLIIRQDLIVTWRTLFFLFLCGRIQIFSNTIFRIRNKGYSEISEMCWEIPLGFLVIFLLIGYSKKFFSIQQVLQRHCQKCHRNFNNRFYLKEDFIKVVFKISPKSLPWFGKTLNTKNTKRNLLKFFLRLLWEHTHSWNSCVVLFGSLRGVSKRGHVK